MSVGKEKKRVETGNTHYKKSKKEINLVRNKAKKVKQTSGKSPYRFRCKTNFHFVGMLSMPESSSKLRQPWLGIGENDLEKRRRWRELMNICFTVVTPILSFSPMPSQCQAAFGGGSLLPMGRLWFGESMNICKAYFQLESPVRLTSSSLPPLWKLLLHFTHVNHM